MLKEFRITPPDTIKKYLYTPEGLAFLNDTASILFNEPLFAIGVKLGRIQFDVIENDILGCVLELRMHSTQTRLQPLSFGIEP